MNQADETENPLHTSKWSIPQPIYKHRMIDETTVYSLVIIFKGATAYVVGPNHARLRYVPCKLRELSFAYCCKTSRSRRLSQVSGKGAV